MRQNAFVSTNELTENYDACVDCALEQYIIKKYISTYKQNTLSYYYKLLNNVTFWDIKSFKCPNHSYLKTPKTSFILKYDIDYVDHQIKVEKRLNQISLTYLH